MECRLSRRTARNTLAKRCRFNENLFIELRVKWEIPRAVRPAGGKTSPPKNGSKDAAFRVKAEGDSLPRKFPLHLQAPKGVCRLKSASKGIAFRFDLERGVFGPIFRRRCFAAGR